MLLIQPAAPFEFCQCHKCADVPGMDKFFGRGSVIGWRHQLPGEAGELIKFTRLAYEHEAHMNFLLHTAKCEKWYMNSRRLS